METLSRLRIVVTGLVGTFPLGGVFWDYLQYVYPQPHLTRGWRRNSRMVKLKCD